MYIVISASQFISGSTPETFCDTTDEVPEEIGEIYRALVLSRKRIEDERQAGEVKFNVTSVPTLPGIEYVYILHDVIWQCETRASELVELSAALNI